MSGDRRGWRRDTDAVFFVRVRHALSRVPQVYRHCNRQIAAGQVPGLSSVAFFLSLVFISSISKLEIIYVRRDFISLSLLKFTNDFIPSLAHPFTIFFISSLYTFMIPSLYLFVISPLYSRMASSLYLFMIPSLYPFVTLINLSTPVE